METPQDNININRPIDMKGNTALHDLCGRGGAPVDAVASMLARGADINRQNNQGVPPLGLAIQSGNLSIAQFLIEQGALLYFKTDNDRHFNALHIACARGSSLMTGMLLGHGAGHHVNMPGIGVDGREDGLHCLHTALVNSNSGLIDMLLAAGAHINAEAGNQKAAPIHLAAQHSPPQTILHLLKNGADLEHVQPGTGRTPLHIAVENGRGPAFEQFLQMGADINTTDMRGHTPLMTAVTRNNVNLVRIMLQHPEIEIDRRMPVPPAMTALMLAAFQGYSEIINLLLRNGADAVLTDTFNNTASALARQQRYEATAHLLLLAENEASRKHCDDAYRRHRKKPRGPGS